MEKITDTFQQELTSLIKKYMTEDTLFLDIETTGFQADYQSCYLIGCLSRNGNTFTETQFFAETPAEEEAMLRVFLDELGAYRQIITFNGDHFDLPFLTKRFAKYHMLPHFELFHSLDLYKEARKLNKLLQLPKLNQKTIEAFLGIQREDLYSGGELIRVYQEFSKDRSPEKRELLLLHNYDDVKNMLPLLSLLAYKEVGSLSVSLETLRNENRKELVFTGLTNLFLPKKLLLQTERFFIALSENTIRGSIPLENDKKKYFFPNPKQYVYIEDEQLLLPKQLSASIPSSRKRSAKKEECFTETSGCFLSVPPAFLSAFDPLSDTKMPILDFLEDEHLFQNEYKDKIRYLKIDPDRITTDFTGQLLAFLVSASFS